MYDQLGSLCIWGLAMFIVGFLAGLDRGRHLAPRSHSATSERQR